MNNRSDINFQKLLNFRKSNTKTVEVRKISEGLIKLIVFPRGGSMIRAHSFDIRNSNDLALAINISENKYDISKNEIQEAFYEKSG